MILPDFNLFNVAIASLVAVVFLFGVWWGKHMGLQEAKEKAQHNLRSGSR